MKKYAIHLTEEERREVLHALARLATSKSAGVALAKQPADKRKKSEQLELVETLWHRIRDTEPTAMTEKTTCKHCKWFRDIRGSDGLCYSRHNDNTPHVESDTKACENFTRTRK